MPIEIDRTTAGGQLQIVHNIIVAQIRYRHGDGAERLQAQQKVNNIFYKYVFSLSGVPRDVQLPMNLSVNREVGSSFFSADVERFPFPLGSPKSDYRRLEYHYQTGMELWRAMPGAFPRPNQPLYHDGHQAFDSQPAM